MHAGYLDKNLLNYLILLIHSLFCQNFIAFPDNKIVFYFHMSLEKFAQPSFPLSPAVSTMRMAKDGFPWFPIIGPKASTYCECERWRRQNCTHSSNFCLFPQHFVLISHLICCTYPNIFVVYQPSHSLLPSWTFYPPIFRQTFTRIFLIFIQIFV